jgi:hypothetical protein
MKYQYNKQNHYNIQKHKVLDEITNLDLLLIWMLIKMIHRLNISQT